MTAVTEEKGGGTLRHMILALLVAVFMAVIMALSALLVMAAHVVPSKETGGGSQNKGADSSTVALRLVGATTFGPRSRRPPCPPISPATSRLFLSLPAPPQ